MEWAQSITTVNAQICAAVLDADGASSYRPLEDLDKLGLPTSSKAKRRVATVCLSDLQEASANQYLEHFGIRALPHGDACGMYTWRTRQSTWVIPALALIRGIFQPSQLFTSELFRPQAVERLAMADPDDPKRVKVLAPWSLKSMTAVGGPFLTLEWLLWDPLARRLANSVHCHAMRGSIGVDRLPITFGLAAYGERQGEYFYVTRLNALEVLMSSDGAHKAGQKHLLSQASAGKKPGKMNVKLSDTGDLRLTPAEWEVLKQHLPRQKTGYVTHHDLKKVLENILAYATGDATSWSDLEARGTSTSVDKSCYRRWINSGTLAVLVDELNRMRAPRSN